MQLYTRPLPYSVVVLAHILESSGSSNDSLGFVMDFVQLSRYNIWCMPYAPTLQKMTFQDSVVHMRCQPARISFDDIAKQWYTMVDDKRCYLSKKDDVSGITYVWLPTTATGAPYQAFVRQKDLHAWCTTSLLYEK